VDINEGQSSYYLSLLQSFLSSLSCSIEYKYELW